MLLPKMATPFPDTFPAPPLKKGPGNKVKPGKRFSSGSRALLELLFFFGRGGGGGGGGGILLPQSYILTLATI